MEKELPTTIDAAVILAAGMCTRFRDTLSDRPKGFLELKSLPIIERSIQQLISNGIKEITIVTGYLSTYYEALAERYAHVRTIHNTLYATSGSMYSLCCARDLVATPFLLLESDLLYERRALETLLAFSQENAILVSGFTNSGDEVYVATNGNRVNKLSKQHSELQNIVGELVGISKISPNMFQKMLRYAETYFDKDLKLDYEDCINGITNDTDIFFCKVTDLLWAEIDDASHLSRAKHQILPRIQTKERWQ